MVLANPIYMVLTNPWFAPCVALKQSQHKRQAAEISIQK
jgi:hypothetical protein